METRKECEACDDGIADVEVDCRGDDEGREIGGDRDGSEETKNESRDVSERAGWYS